MSTLRIQYSTDDKDKVGTYKQEEKHYQWCKRYNKINKGSQMMVMSTLSDDMTQTVIGPVSGLKLFIEANLADNQLHLYRMWCGTIRI